VDNNKGGSVDGAEGVETGGGDDNSEGIGNGNDATLGNVNTGEDGNNAGGDANEVDTTGPLSGNTGSSIDGVIGVEGAGDDSDKGTGSETGKDGTPAAGLVEQTGSAEANSVDSLSNDGNTSGGLTGEDGTNTDSGEESQTANAIGRDDNDAKKPNSAGEITTGNEEGEAGASAGDNPQRAADESGQDQDSSTVDPFATLLGLGNNEADSPFGAQKRIADTGDSGTGGDDSGDDESGGDGSGDNTTTERDPFGDLLNQDNGLNEINGILGATTSTLERRGAKAEKRPKDPKIPGSDD